MNHGQRIVILYRRQGLRPTHRKEMKKAKWLSEKALQIAVKRHEKQRRNGKIFPSECRVPKSSKDKKSFLSDQCREIEENN